nr:MAG TPA: hypothetical protein [Caudoviricetes sp.]
MSADFLGTRVPKKSLKIGFIWCVINRQNKKNPVVMGFLILKSV